MSIEGFLSLILVVGYMLGLLRCLYLDIKFWNRYGDIINQLEREERRKNGVHT